MQGFSKYNKSLAFVFASFLLSLSGIPPFIGFFSKFFIFESCINQELYYLVVFLGIASVINSFYYLRIVKLMFFNSSGDT